MVVDFPEWLNWTRYKTRQVLTRMWLAAAGSVDWHNHCSRHCQCSFQNPSILCLCFPIFTAFALNCPHLQLFLRDSVLCYWDHLAHTDKEPEMLHTAAIRPTNGSGVWKPSKPVSGWKNSEAYFILPRSLVGSVKLCSTGFCLKSCPCLGSSSSLPCSPHYFPHFSWEHIVNKSHVHKYSPQGLLLDPYLTYVRTETITLENCFALSIKAEYIHFLWSQSHSKVHTEEIHT